MIACTKSPLVVLTLIVFAGGCGTPELKEFRSASGGFKVLMPGQPKEQSQNVQGINVKVFMVDLGQSAFMVSVIPLPIAQNESKAVIQNRLDGAVQGAVGNIKATLTKQSDIQLDGKYPGREFFARLPDNKGEARGRMYIVNGRLFQIMAFGPSSVTNSEDATRFLKSFALTK